MADLVIIDEVWYGSDPHLHYRSTVQWYDGWLKQHRKPGVAHTHGEIKNLRDLRRQAMKQEVRHGLRPVRPGSVDRVTRPAS